MTRYAVLAYGPSEAVYMQATMAFVSLLAYAPEPRELVAITDHPERFARLAPDVRVHAVSADQLAKWIGPSPISMRQKIEAARAVMPSDGALVMLDADTLAVADLSPLVQALKNGEMFMHKREFVLAESRRRGNRALWRVLEGKTFGGWQLETSAMWNSGVIAMPSTDARLLDDALRLYDALLAAGIRHFALEQLAVGVVLERTSRLREASHWITHYWGNKLAYEQEIRRRLSAATPRELADQLRGNPIALPSEVRPDRWQKFRRWLLSRKNTEVHGKK